MNIRNLNIFTHQPLHDIEIVNHQVEHDVDIQRARRKLTHAMDFKINRLTNMRPQRDEGGIEALEMSDLKHGVAFFSGAYHPVSLVERSRYRFFNQDVNAC